MAQPLTVRKTLVMNTLEELQSSVAEMENTVLTTSVPWLLPCSQLCGRRVKENPLVKTILHDIWTSACQQSPRKKTLLQAETIWSICKPPWPLTFSLNPALNISPNIQCNRDASLLLKIGPKSWTCDNFSRAHALISGLSKTKPSWTILSQLFPYSQWVATADSTTYSYLIWKIFTLDALPDSVPSAGLKPGTFSTLSKCVTHYTLVLPRPDIICIRYHTDDLKYY